MDPNDDILQRHSFKRHKAGNSTRQMSPLCDKEDFENDPTTSNEFPHLYKTNPPKLISQTKPNQKTKAPEVYKSKDFNDAKQNNKKAIGIFLSKQSINKAIKTLNKKKPETTTIPETQEIPVREKNNGTSGFPWTSQTENSPTKNQTIVSLINPDQSSQNPNNGTSGFPWKTQPDNAKEISTSETLEQESVKTTNEGFNTILSFDEELFKT